MKDGLPQRLSIDYTKMTTMSDDEDFVAPPAVMTASFETDTGHVLKFSLDTTDDAVSYVLYVPSIDRTCHANFVGVSPSGIKHYKYIVKNITIEQGKAVIDSFIKGGWRAETETSAFASDADWVVGANSP